MKKYVVFMILSVMLFHLSGCGKKDTVQESVVRTDTVSDDDVQIVNNPLQKGTSYAYDRLSVAFYDILYEDATVKLQFRIDNNGEKPCIVSTADMSINGLMCSEALYVTAEAGQTTEATVEIGNSWFAERNITQIAQVEYRTVVYDTDNNEISRSDVLLAETDYGDYDQQYDNSGMVLYENKGFRLSVRSLRKSKLSEDMELELYCENDTDSSISVMSSDVFVNGKAVKPLFVLTVGANKKAEDSMLFYRSDLEENHIEQIESITAAFKGFNDNLETVFETDRIEIPVQD